MTALLERVLNHNEPNAERKGRKQHPDGFTPGVVSPSAKKPGEIVAEPLVADSGAEVDWSETFRAWGMDPEQWQIIEPVEFRFWDAAIGQGEVQRMKYFKVRFVARRQNLIKAADVEDLIKSIRKRKIATTTRTGSGDVLIACWSDTQFGKDDGDGLRGTIERCYRYRDQIVERAKDEGIVHLVMPSLGDIIENCAGHYAQQRYRTEANLTQQVRVAYELFADIVASLAGLFQSIRIPVVGGNHGENRDTLLGQNATDFADNWDTEIWRVVDHSLHTYTNGQFDHVVITTSGHSLTQTIDVNGKILGLAHGHQFSRGADAQKKAIEWFKNQALNKTRVGDCDVLLSGHFHHYQHIELSRNEEGRITTWIQAPTMDGGSDWFEHQTGASAPPGMMSFTIKGDGRFGRDVIVFE